MSVDVTVETEIARRPDEVAAFAMDPTNDREWIGGLSTVRTLTDGPVGVGTQVERVASFLGKRIEYVNEITGYEPGRRLDMRSVKAPFPMTVTYEFEPAPQGSVARIRTGGDAKGFYTFAGPLLSFMVKRGVARDLAKLKTILEGKPTIKRFGPQLTPARARRRCAGSPRRRRSAAWSPATRASARGRRAPCRPAR